MKIPITTAANGLMFDSNYWKKIYKKGIDIDGIYNSKEHVQYIYALFTLCEIKINSIADFGFGKANLLKDFVKKFNPERVIAIDPSLEMVEKLYRAKWLNNLDITISRTSLQEFNITYLKDNPVDFSICNSVFQYIEKDLEKIFKKLSLITKYLYFSVPTDNDYFRMKKELGFQDPYAYKRPLKFYLTSMRPHFTIVSFNLLESNYFGGTNFPDEFYRL